ncbi:MAG: UvrD-helicase domain-containing protein [Parachlamydiales bacterium]|nr:UvrD-helicase domain-containing protein [Parachlamydiales bacterium]
MSFSLNKEQQKAVNTVNGRVLVLAGAGSGKTKVLTYRIAHLINNFNISPSSILGLTFTNKAAEEMRSRLKELIPKSKAAKVTLTTFHSFCVQILRKEANSVGYSPNFSIYDDKDIKRVANHVVKESSLDVSPTLLVEAISKIKNKNLTIDELEQSDEKVHLKELTSSFDNFLKAYNAIDFDTLLTLTVQLFENNENVLSKYQDQFKYILIDEYQDTNPIQYKIAEALAKKNNNLFVVGDDDQSIYAFRGSSISHILNFKADHIIKLEQNYRSTSLILHAANAVIKNNEKRHDKTLFSENYSNDKISLFHAPTEIDEASAVINRIIKLKKEKNLKFKDFAILYRSNALSRNFEVGLINASYQKDGQWVRGIPYTIYGGMEFADRAETKDLFAYLRIICNPKDDEALLRVINVPRRGISDKTLSVLQSYKSEHKLSLYKVLEKIKNNEISIDIQSKAKKGIETLINTIEKAKQKFSKKPLYEAFEYLINEIDYKKAIEEEVKSEKARAYKWENAKECINALAQYEEEKKEDANLVDFVSSSLLSKENINKNKNFSDDRLKLMTIHSSKGLEFEACFIIGVEDHMLPHEKSFSLEAIEEERRLFYVAITRAKKYLTLSMARTRKNKGSAKKTNPSRFLFEIPKNLLEITSWKTFD